MGFLVLLLGAVLLCVIVGCAIIYAPFRPDAQFRPLDPPAVSEAGAIFLSGSLLLNLFDWPATTLLGVALVCYGMWRFWKIRKSIRS